MLRILIAPNAYKHSLPADEAADAIAEGLGKSRLACACTSFPVGDGGDGTGDLLVRHRHGTYLSAPVTDPLGRLITAPLGLVDDGRTAVVELAAASGIRLLTPDERDPLRATSAGTGQLIRYALDQGVRQLTLAVGGSATVDGGLGLLRALGVRFLDQQQELIESPDRLTYLTRIDMAGLDPRLATCPITVLCDVTNPLLGPQGAAAVFGPQKGASPADVVTLEAGLARLAAVVARQTGQAITQLPRGGAAGGVSAGLRALLGARLVNGIDYFLDETGFDTALAAADLAITGEGSLDEQTLQGKGPLGVAVRAKARHLPVIGLAGHVPEQPSDALNRYFDMLLAIGNTPTDLPTALQRTRPNLSRTARQVGNLLAGYVAGGQSNS